MQLLNNNQTEQNSPAIPSQSVPPGKFAAGLKWLVWGGFGLLAGLVWVAIWLNPPQLQTSFLPGQTNPIPELTAARGFNKPEQDRDRQSFVWTTERATLEFDLAINKTVTINFEMRSAAVAGGPDAPLEVLVNGQTAAQFQPDPRRLDFQRFSLKINNPVAARSLRIELVARPFRPAGDARTLGLMVKNIELDKSEAWAGVGQRFWLWGMLPGLALAAILGLAIATRTKNRVWGYVAIIACGIAALATLAGLYLLGQIGPLDRLLYPLWLAGTGYLALFFGFAALLLPLGSPKSDSLYHYAYQSLPISIRQKTSPICQAVTGRVDRTGRWLGGPLEPGWVGGLALLLLFIVGQTLNLQGETYDWTQYLTLGTLFPALLLGLALLAPTSLGQNLAGPLRWLKLGLTAFLVGLTTLFIFKQASYYALALALIQTGIIGLVSWRWKKPFTVAQGLAGFLAAALAWTAASTLVWWQPFGQFLLSSPYTLAIFILSGLLTLGWLFYPLTLTIPQRLSKLPWRGLGHTLAIIIFGWASMRTVGLFEPGTAAEFHWSTYVGPAELVRQGGAILWDTPSPYGFLSVLTIAALPLGTVWQTFFWLNALFLFMSGGLVYLLLRPLRADGLGWLLALSGTLATVFLLAGQAQNLAGPSLYPSSGPYRFFWCYALLAIIWREGRKPGRRVWWTGNLVWLVAVLWAEECAIYASAIWLPAYALMLWRSAYRPKKQQSLGRAALWLLLPVALIVGAVGLISLIYSLSLGHGPDWWTYFEYGAYFQTSFWVTPIELTGPVWGLFLAFAIASTSLYYGLRRGLHEPALSLLWGGWAALWVTASYFVGRSAANNVTNLLPFLWLAVLLPAQWLVSEKTDSRITRWVWLWRWAAVPLLIVSLTLAFGNQSAVSRALFSAPANATQIERLLPVMDSSLQQLMAQAGVKSDDPINAPHFSPEVIIFPAWPLPEGGTRYTVRAWLTNYPYELFITFPPERAQLLLQRFAQRTRLSGWFVEYKPYNLTSVLPWFESYLRQHYTPTRVFENSDWRLTWWEYGRGTGDGSQ